MSGSLIHFSVYMYDASVADVYPWTSERGIATVGAPARRHALQIATINAETDEGKILQSMYKNRNRHFA